MPVIRYGLQGRWNSSNDVRLVFTVDAPGGTPLMSDIVLWFNDMFDSSLLAHMSSSIAFQRIVSEVPAGGGHWAYTDERPFVHAGTGGGDALPPYAAAVVIGITPSRRRGKKFIPGVLESDNINGDITSGYRTVLESFASKWIAPAFTGFGSDFIPGVCKPDGSSFLAFSAYSVDAQLGTQVRRKSGRGS